MNRLQKYEKLFALTIEVLILTAFCALLRHFTHENPD